ncbi:VC0807 family protein [Pseudocolwellia sp. AS88]|uniref:VC0807 family protein n=1 Tax=Pseudocolwellia sp. AS88 TaxID=3063958 RepID=UPI0026EBE4F9|nr:VC0807 family protein [Pseudocolwellia sp. AS88]MDO7083450.1 VC0807 family protein [Pseudocolwellia sp. AS88]
MTAEKPKNKPFVEIIFNVALPSWILMKFSTPEYFGVVAGLIIALSFPLGYAIYDYLRTKEMNLISAFGFFSTLLTGGIALFELSVQWLAIKEASIPTLIALFTIFTGMYGKPLIAKLLLNEYMFKVGLVYEKLTENGKTDVFRNKIGFANKLLALTFIFSAVMNYALAKWLVTSPAGTVEFNEELGHMTLMSYPIIVIPSMLMLAALMYYVSRVIKDLTGYKLTELMVEQ